MSLRCAWAGPAAPALVALLAAWPAEARSLTSTQAKYSIAKVLTAGTPVEIVNVPADDRQLSLQKDYIERRKGALAPTFASATAVVALTNALPGDPLYRFARAANISIVDIDAPVPWSHA